MQPISHHACVRVGVPAGFAFAQLSSADCVGRWALGSMQLTATDNERVFKGVSLFDGSDAFVEIEPHPQQLLIDFHVGDAVVRSPRISIRVVSGEAVGHGPDACIVSMSALRALSMSEERWQRTCVTHQLEVLLFKEQIETAYANGQGRAER